MGKIKIHYIANYAGERKDLNISPAGNTKMEYIIYALGTTNYPVTVFSTAEVKKGISFGKTKKISQNVKLRYISSFGFKPYFLQRIEKLWNKLGLYLYLKKLGKNDVVVVYHNTPYMPVIKKLKNRKFKLIYEVEEIYSLVSLKDEGLVSAEQNFVKCADAYIFPTEMLNDSINEFNKPSVTVYGTYKVESQRMVESFEDEKIHCLYAGTLRSEKGGAVVAASSAEFLSDKYHIHILGFGSDEDKEFLMSEIERVSKVSDCKVTFDGLLSGEEYIRFMQKCQIGLSTQNPNAAFNETSFPSKVLSYLANGLRVVSVKIEALERSAVSNLLCYYEGSDPRSLAEAILSVDISEPYDSRADIEKLNVEFIENLSKMINKIIVKK